jgi:hypothetical protein
MKVSLQTIALPTTNTTFNVTHPSITSDFQGAILFGGSPSAENTTTAGMYQCIGAVDSAGRMGGSSQGASDATSGASAYCNCLSSWCYNILNSATETDNCTITYSSTLSNGVNLSQSSTDGVAHLVNVLMFAGSDVQFAVSNALDITSATSATITHNLTGQPDALIVLAPNNNSAGGGALNYSMGFWDGTNSLGLGYTITQTANPTNVGARCGTTNLGEIISQAQSDIGSWSISSVGATTLTLTRSSVSAGTANIVVIAWRHLQGNSAALAYTDVTPASSGNNTPVTGLAVSPQLWLNVSTRLASTAFANSDAAGSWGFGAAVHNPASGTQMAACSGSFEYNVSNSSVAKTYNSNGTACQTLTDAGVPDFTSILVSWNSGGFTEQVASASAGQRINLVYGVQSVFATPSVGAHTGWAYQAASSTNTTSAITTAVSGSSFLVFLVTNVTTGVGVSDNKSGNTYTQVGSFVHEANDGGYLSCWLCGYGNGGSGMTFTGTCSSVVTLVDAIEIQGGAGPTLVNVEVGAYTYVPPPASNPVTTTSPSCLVVAAVFTGQNQTTFSPGGSTFTTIDAYTVLSAGAAATASSLAVTTGSYDPAWTNTASTYAAAMITVSFKPPTVPPSVSVFTQYALQPTLAQ